MATFRLNLSQLTHPPPSPPPPPLAAPRPPVGHRETKGVPTSRRPPGTWRTWKLGYDVRGKAFFEPRLVAPNSHPATTFSVGGSLPPATTTAIRPLAKARTAECVRHVGTKCKINGVLCARTRRWDGNTSSRSGCTGGLFTFTSNQQAHLLLGKFLSDRLKKCFDNFTQNPKTGRRKYDGVLPGVLHGNLPVDAGEKKAGNESFIAEEASSSSSISGTTSH